MLLLLRFFILSVLPLTFALESMDNKELSFQRISRIQVLGNTAFFPNQTIINEAIELGFVPCVGEPFVTVQLINDCVRFKNKPEYLRKLLHIPCTAIIEGNRKIDLSPTWSFTYDETAQERARKQMLQFYSCQPWAKMDLNNLNNPLVRTLYEDNFIRRQQDRNNNGAEVAKITFGIDEN